MSARPARTRARRRSLQEHGGVGGRQRRRGGECPRPRVEREARRAGARLTERRRCRKRRTCQPPRAGSSRSRGRGAGGRRPGARRARGRARGLVWGRGPGGRGIPPLGTVPRPGLPEKRRAVAAHQPRPRGQAWGQRFRESICAWRGACSPPTRALLPGGPRP